MSLFLLLLPLRLQLPRLSSSLSICSPFGIMMQLVTCRRGASCRHRRCCHRTGMGEGAHLRTKIEFGPRRLGAQPDVLLMRFATAQHYIHLQKVYRIYIYIYGHSFRSPIPSTRTLLPKMSASSSVTVSCVWQKKMIYSRSGLAGDCRNNLCRKTKDIAIYRV